MKVYRLCSACGLEFTVDMEKLMVCPGCGNTRLTPLESYPDEEDCYVQSDEEWPDEQF